MASQGCLTIGGSVGNSMALFKSFKVPKIPCHTAVSPAPSSSSHASAPQKHLPRRLSTLGGPQNTASTSVASSELRRTRPTKPYASPPLQNDAERSFSGAQSRPRAVRATLHSSFQVGNGPKAMKNHGKTVGRSSSGPSLKPMRACSPAPPRCATKPKSSRHTAQSSASARCLNL